MADGEIPRAARRHREREAGESRLRLECDESRRARSSSTIAGGRGVVDDARIGELRGRGPAGGGSAAGARPTESQVVQLEISRGGYSSSRNNFASSVRPRACGRAS